MTQLGAAQPWPFWAPTPHDAIERALDLAGVGPGCRLLDLGCGDGRMLEAAARRGATATGYEASPRMAQVASERLALYSGRVRVIEADFHSAPLDADVIFAFLSPATLFRLRDRFVALEPGTRIVTYAYGVVGWQADRVEEGCFLYTMPSRPSSSAVRRGWPAAGIAVACPPGRTVLRALLFGAEQGPLDLEISTTLPAFAEVYSGDPRPGRPMNMPVDIKLTAGAKGQVYFGGIRLQGRELIVAMLAGGEHFGSYRLNAAGVAELKQRYQAVKRGSLPSVSFLDGLAAAEYAQE